MTDLEDKYETIEKQKEDFKTKADKLQKELDEVDKSMIHAEDHSVDPNED